MLGAVCPKYKYLGSKNEIQVPDVNCPHVQGEQFTLCKRAKRDISNLEERANSVTKISRLRDRYEPISRRKRGQGISSVHQLPRTWTNSLVEFLFESGMQDISRTRLSLVFK